MNTKSDYTPSLFAMKFNFENLTNVDEKLNIIFDIIIRNYDTLNKIYMEVSDLKRDIQNLQFQIAQHKNVIKY